MAALRRPLPILSLALVLLGPGTAAVRSGTDAPEVKKADRTTFKVLFHDIHVLVGVRLLAVKHKPYKYLPLQISIANHGRGAARADLKNFRLTDDQGREYPIAPYAEVRAEHGLLQYDRERARAFGFSDLDPMTARDLPPRFYPLPGETVDPKIEILAGERLVDFLYFRDEAQAAPTRFTLTIEGLIDAPALRIPMEVPGH